MNTLFSEISPSLYDLSLPHVVPGLDAARAIRAEVFRALVGSRGPWVGADFGIGTGRDLATLLPSDARGQVFGFDESSTLTADLARRGRLSPSNHADIDLQLVLTDIGSETALGAVSPDLIGGFDFVHSAFAIHNLPSPNQARAYQHAAALLKPGGILICLDLVELENPELAAQAHRFDLAFIERNMQVPPKDVSPSQWALLRERWLRHYREENYLLPLWGSTSSSIFAMLREVGFGTPDVVFRHGHTTLIAAVKESGT